MKNKNIDNSLNILTNSLCKLSTKIDIKNFLDDMLTPKEIFDLEERIKIIKLLLDGYTQRDIADKLGISVTTVNRGSRVLKYGKGGAKKIFE